MITKGTTMASMIDRILEMDQRDKENALAEMNQERLALPDTPKIIWALDMYAAQGVTFTPEQEEAFAAKAAWFDKWFGETGDEEWSFTLEIRDPRDKSLVGYSTHKRKA